MARKKGTLRQIAEAVGDAVQTVAAEVGLVPEANDSASTPQPKAVRKAARKKAIAQVEKEQHDTTAARRAARRRG